MADEYNPQDQSPNPIKLIGDVTKAARIANPLPDYVSPEVWQQAKDSVQYVGDAFGRSEDQVRSNIGWNKAYLGLISNEDAMLKFNPDAIKQSRNQRVVDYEKTHDYLNSAKYLFPMMSSIKNWSTNAAAGTVSGTIAGGLGGLAGGPAAEVTVPAGAAVGATMGFRAGVISGAYEQAAGEVYGKLITSGVDPVTAREAATVAGAAGGAMQGWFLNPILKYEPLTKEAVKQTAGLIAKQAATTIGKSVAASDVTTGTELLVSALAELKTGKKVAPTWDQVVDALVQSTLNGAAQGALAAGVHLAGQAVENATNKTRQTFTDRVKNALMNLPQNKEAAQAKVETLKLEVSVMQKEDAVKAAETKLEEAKAEGKPTATLAKVVELKKAELDLVKPSEPASNVILQGHVEIKTKERLSPAEAKLQALEDEHARVTSEGRNGLAAVADAIIYVAGN